MDRLMCLYRPKLMAICSNICNLEINNSFSEEKKENDKSSHVFNGLIEVEVKRKVYLFLDYETDFNFDDAYISSGFLDEIPS